MPNLLEIVIQKGSPFAPSRKADPAGPRYRTRIPTRPRPMKKKEHWQPPPAVLRAMSEEARAAAYGLTDEAATLVIISKAVVDSPNIRLLDVGAALGQITVKSLTDVKLDSVFTVDLPPLKGLVREQRCIPTSREHASRIFYAHYLDSTGRPHTDEFGHPVFRRFVEEELPVPTNKITLIVRHHDTKLIVVSAHYGVGSQKVPGSAGATLADQLWWYDPKSGDGHAMVVLKEMKGRIQNPTRTCPWKYPTK